LSILDTSFVTLVGRPSLIVTNGGFLFSAHRWKLSGTTGIARGFRSYKKTKWKDGFSISSFCALFTFCSG
ncbi:MAG: hypothetical protein SOR93_00005, partial [Clostridiales Family XIII bacterium]|nr:hypothetical protein [Clostridia bacterium]MDY3009627.1 hypothetical protein [Clostridiales Family XIII bacterium]